MTFQTLNIMDYIIKPIEAIGYLIPTPIQEQAIPVILNHQDVLGTAQTGTGKTAAFAIPILQNMYINDSNKPKNRNIKVLVLSPTRELAIQIKENFVIYNKNMGYKIACIYGGVNQYNQVKQLQSGVDILIATPGRLLDLIKQKFVKLGDVKYFVLDEADRMLDMGFIIDVNKIVSYIPKERQTMLFSATLPKEITKLANDLLQNPKRISVANMNTPIEVIKQTVYKVIRKDKIHLLIKILSEKDCGEALIFSRTKHGANKIAQDLEKAGISASAIHGNKSQSARELALKQFKEKKIKALIATDIASRGIDINDLFLVINFDLPDVPETYIHRIGRTGRAGKNGVALSFCNPEESDLLQAIEKHTEQTIFVDVNHGYDASSQFVTSKKIVFNKNRASNNQKQTKEPQRFSKNTNKDFEKINQFSQNNHSKQRPTKYQPNSYKHSSEEKTTNTKNIYSYKTKKSASI